MEDAPATEQIDAIIAKAPGWQGPKLAQLRAVITAADPAIIEEVKWKKPSRPEGVAVWSLNGNICMADILKNTVRLTFPKGALLTDPKQIFNTRLDSKSVRAVDFSEEDLVDERALKDLVAQAAKLNTAK
jgi:hypothetical protein